MDKPRKRKFEVEENETIDACLTRMKHEGYTPISRIEKPIFKEVTIDNKVDYIPSSNKIIFEGKLID